jgi:heavy metal efflux system protein
MIQRLIVFTVTQRVFVLVLAISMAIAGALAAGSLPIEAFPDVQDVQVRIIAQMPGEAPQDLEREVTLPIEREITGLPRLTNERSTTMTGLSIVTLTFADGTDDYFARQQVAEHLANVTLPSGVQAQLAPLTTAVGEVYRYMIEAPGLAPDEVRALQDWVVRPALRRTPGVADIVSFGGSIREYQVNVDPLALHRYQVTLPQVTDAVAKASGSAGGASVRQGDTSLVVRADGIATTTDDLRRATVVARQGRPIRLDDVATVQVGTRPRFGAVAFDTRDEVVEGIVSMVKGGNPAEINAALRERIDGLAAQLPAGARITPLYDRTDLVRHTVKTVSENLVVGALLVLAVLLVFLSSLRAALIVATVIPLALLGVFLCLRLLGISANLISLGAVDFGVIIDSAVVIVEALMVKLAVQVASRPDGTLPPGQAVSTLRQTMAELAHPVLASKAIIILAFVPIFTFQRVEGRIFTPVALTLSFALLGALLLTFTLLPTLLAYSVDRKPLLERDKPWLVRLQGAYGRFVDWTLSRSRRLLPLAVIPVGLALLLAAHLGTEFLPKLDEGNIWLTITLPTSASLETTRSVEGRVRRALLGYPEVRHVISQSGRPDDGSDPKGPNNLEMLVDLQPRSTWRFADKEALTADMSANLEAIPGITTNFSQVIQDNVEESLSGFRGEIVVKVFGPDLDILERKGIAVASILRGIRGATDVDITHVGGQAEVVVTPDRERLSHYGLSVRDLDDALAGALAGTPVSTFFEGDRPFDVVVRVNDRSRDSIDAIGRLPIAVPGMQVGNGASLLSLNDVAQVQVRQGASRIQREGGARMVIVKANLIGRDQGSFVAEAQAAVARGVHLPDGYQLNWGGEFENSQRAAKRLQVIVPVTVLMIFSLLFWTFASVRLATIVLTMVPFTFVGGFLALWLAHLHLSVSAAVGFITVAGISVQNGVILVEEVLQGLRKGAGRSIAIGRAAVDRLRPILMTTLMAGLGLLPAALSRGIGSETQRPFACVIVGGIVTGTLFTLVLLPAVLLRFGRLSEERDVPA